MKITTLRYGLLAILGLALAQASDKPLNLILIMADDLGYEVIGANGGESYPTPNLDRIAKSGMRFEHCYSQPICTPSRVQIMTGQYNDRNYTKFGELDRKQTTFAHMLKKQGYSTCITGKWQLGKEKDAPQHFGFDESLLWQHTRPRVKLGLDKKYDSRFENPYLERNGVEEQYTKGEFGPDLCTDFVCEFIEKKKEGPFFVYYPMILTHCPFIPVPGGDDWDPKSPGCPTYKGDAKYFGGMATHMDMLIGRIVAQVEKSGVAERTVIIFTGDNGTDRPVVSRWKGIDYDWGKGKTTDAGTRVPLIVHAPGLKGKGVSQDLVNFSDMLPTLWDLAGQDTEQLPEQIDGQSFAPQLRGEKGEPRDHSFCWYQHTGKLKVFARTQRYKLYRDGRFFDVSKDRLEKSPIEIKDLNEQARTVRKRLQEVLDQRQKLTGR